MESLKEKEELLQFEQLPFDVIEKILKCRALSVEDVLNFSSTCRYYRLMVLSSNSLWKQKYWDRWSDYEDLVEACNIENYFFEFSQAYRTHKRAQELLEDMPYRFNKELEVLHSELEEWIELLNEKAENYMYLSSYLMDILNTEQTINTIEAVDLQFWNIEKDYR